MIQTGAIKEYIDHSKSDLKFSLIKWKAHAYLIIITHLKSP